MTALERVYSFDPPGVPSAPGGEGLAAVLERFPSKPEPGRGQVTVFHDTFDWRLLRARRTLEVRTGHPASGSRAAWQWTCLDDGVSCRSESSATPGFADDLPATPYREELAGILEMRRLLPVVTVRLRSRVVRVLDSERKTVARLVIQEGSVAGPTGLSGGARTPLPTVLRVVAVRGYVEEFAEVVRFLEGELGLSPRAGGLFEVALQVLGVEAGRDPSKVRFDLGPTTRSDQALKTVHRELLRVMLANEAGLRADVDSEFCHDFRVAIRRTRSALGSVKGVFPEDVTAHFSREFKWLGGVAGPTRDMDVVLLKFPEYERVFSFELRQDLAPLREFLVARQKTEHAALVKCLDSRRYRTLIDEWRLFLEETPLEETPPAETDLARAVLPIREVASDRISKAYRRVRARGDAIRDDTPAQEVHDLRIDCKKLRYLLTFFASLYPDGAVASLVAVLKRLQENLGDFNDYEVQQVSLREFAREMSAAGLGNSDTLLAMGRLVHELARGQARERRRFARRYRVFTSKEHRAPYRELFGRRRRKKSAGGGA